MKKTTKSDNRLSIRLDEKVMEKLEKISVKRGKKKGTVARQIIADYFIKQRADSLETLINKVERVYPDLEKQGEEYKAMKTALKETVVAVYQTANTVRELKRSEFLTYDTLKKLVRELQK